MSTPLPHPAAFVASPEAQESLVIALANPFATRWIPASLVFDMNFGNDNPRPGGVIHGGNSPQSNRVVDTHWYQITVQAREFSWDPAVQTFTLDELKQLVETPGQGTPSSLLKIRLELAMTYSKKRFIDLDIGAGVCTFIAAKYINSVTVLVPDPTSIPAGLPEGFPVTANVATKIITRCHCDWAPGSHVEPLYYTKTFFQAVRGGGEQSSGFLPIVTAAKEVVILGDADFGAAATAEFVYAINRPIEQGYVVPAGTFGVGAIELGGATSNQSERAPIPGTANALIITPDFGTAAAFSVVQFLQL